MDGLKKVGRFWEAKIVHPVWGVLSLKYVKEPKVVDVIRDLKAEATAIASRALSGNHHYFS